MTVNGDFGRGCAIPASLQLRMHANPPNKRRLRLGAHAPADAMKIAQRRPAATTKMSGRSGSFARVGKGGAQSRWRQHAPSDVGPHFCYGARSTGGGYAGEHERSRYDRCDATLEQRLSQETG